jgi:hypothetical protein
VILSFWSILITFLQFDISLAAGGGFNISPLKSRDGNKPRSQVQHLIQIDLKGWGVGYLPSFQQHCLLHMLNSVAGLREWFAQTDGNPSLFMTGMPVMVGMQPNRVPSKRSRKLQEVSSQPADNMVIHHFTMMDEESDDDGDLPYPEEEQVYVLLVILLFERIGPTTCTYQYSTALHHINNVAWIQCQLIS